MDTNDSDALMPCVRVTLPLRVRVFATIAFFSFAILQSPADEASTTNSAEVEATDVDEQLKRAQELLATDRDAGIAELRHAARSNRADILFVLGRTLFYDVGTEEARVEGVKWLVESAKLGDPEAQLNLATLHTLGDGVERSHPTAFKLTRGAAAFGHPKAQAMLGQIYLQGDRAVRRDPVLAFAHAGVAVSLGYADGHTVRVSAGRQLTAGEKEEARAIAEEIIGDLKESFPDRFPSLEYKAGIDHLLPDDVKTLVSRAEGGDVEAMMAVAELFTSDMVVPMDFDAVVDWTRRAAERGHLEALRNLGGYFLYGTYVPHDPFEAFVHLSVADALGGQVSQGDLAKARGQIAAARGPEADRRILQMIKTIHATKARR